MSKFSIKLQDKVRCKITHQLSGTEILTDLAPEYGGKGRSFSSTDLIAVALGSCILSTIDKVMERAGYDPKQIEVITTKTYTENKTMIKRISLEIFHPEKLGGVVLKKLERAIATCPVKRTLNEQVEIDIVYSSS